MISNFKKSYNKQDVYYVKFQNVNNNGALRLGGVAENGFLATFPLANINGFLTNKTFPVKKFLTGKC